MPLTHKTGLRSHLASQEGSAEGMHPSGYVYGQALGGLAPTHVSLFWVTSDHTPHSSPRSCPSAADVWPAGSSPVPRPPFPCIAPKALDPPQSFLLGVREGPGGLGNESETI